LIRELIIRRLAWVPARAEDARTATPGTAAATLNHAQWWPHRLAPVIVPSTIEDATVRWGSEQLRGGVRPTNPSNLISGSRAGRMECAGVAEDERRECGRRMATTVVLLWVRDGRFVCRRLIVEPGEQGSGRR